MSQDEVTSPELELALSSEVTNNGLIDYALILGVEALKTALQTSAHILDIGCGLDANFGKELLKRQNKDNLTVVNFSPKVTNLVGIPLGVAGLCQKLPFRDESFDLIVSINAVPKFVHNEQVVPTLTEIHRILSPGGTARLWPAIAEKRNYISYLDHTDMRLEQLEEEVASMLSTDYPEIPRRIIIKKRQAC